MNDKYKITAAEVFKMRMQYKAEFNNLRKTYHEVVVQKSPLGKKHFSSKIEPTTILPQQVKSRQNQTRQKRHFSPVNIPQGVERSISRGKRQFEDKSVDNLANVIRQKYQEKKKSLSQATISKNNRSMINLSHNDSSLMTGLKVGLNDKSLTNIPKSCIKINPKYHRFDNSLLG